MRWKEIPRATTTKKKKILGKMGYQKQEFDSEKQELVNADDDYTEDAADDGFEESFDEE